LGDDRGVAARAPLEFEMRMFILLAAAIAASSLSYVASSGNTRGLSLGKPEAGVEEAGAHPPCVKKVALSAAETGCLMQKHKSRG
jgi:hypothetical protein